LVARLREMGRATATTATLATHARVP
jgi:hypothetical protein